MQIHAFCEGSTPGLNTLLSYPTLSGFGNSWMEIVEQNQVEAWLSLFQPDVSTGCALGPVPRLGQRQATTLIPGSLATFPDLFATFLAIPDMFFSKH